MISFDQDETSPTGREYPHCLTLPLAASTHYPSSIISFELIYHDIRDLLLSYSDDILIQQKFLTLLHLLPVEEKTTPFYCSLLPPILMNPHFSFEILEILLNYDPNILEHQDQYGNTVFHYLCMSSIDLQIIQYFFAKSSIPLKLVNQCGETCLHVAVQSRNIDLRLVELLIFYYPDAINISSRAGKLPIHYLFRASSPDDYDETARQKCLDILLKHNPTSAYVDVTEKITRINILSILPPSVEAIPQPAIQQIERKWSPYSEAYRKFVDQNDQTVSPLSSLCFDQLVGSSKNQEMDDLLHDFQHSRQKIPQKFPISGQREVHIPISPLMS